MISKPKPTVLNSTTLQSSSGIVLGGSFISVSTILRGRRY